ncbi:MAG: transposase [Arcobacteraceae bacterium]|nr:transposase [Arcobacteraceae bacterium]
MKEHCIHCHHKIIYTLQNGYIKCAKCNKKYSLKKYNQTISIIQGFCEDYSANELATKLSLNYLTITKVYQNLRYKIASFCQSEFEKYENNVTEYDEYLYLPNNKKSDINFIYDGQNFLIFDYSKIYTLSLPFSSKYNPSQSNPQDLKKFLQYNKIAKLKTQNNNIKEFCYFFENSIKKYKGVSEENFFYYLKEIEFKFNYTINQRVDILIKLMYDTIPL